MVFGPKTDTFFPARHSLSVTSTSTHMADIMIGMIVVRCCGPQTPIMHLARLAGERAHLEVQNSDSGPTDQRSSESDASASELLGFGPLHARLRLIMAQKSLALGSVSEALNSLSNTVDQLCLGAAFLVHFQSLSYPTSYRPVFFWISVRYAVHFHKGSLEKWI